MKKVRLDIGCGETVEEGWVGIDSFFGGKGIVQTDAGTLPYAPNSVDEIRCIHAFEHFDPALLDDIVEEWWRVLKPEATVNVVVPDATYVLQYFIDHASEPWAYDMIFGRGLHEGDTHRTAWDCESLQALFGAHGFVAFTHKKWDEPHHQVSIFLEGLKRV